MILGGAKSRPSEVSSRACCGIRRYELVLHDSWMILEALRQAFWASGGVRHPSDCVEVFMRVPRMLMLMLFVWSFCQRVRKTGCAKHYRPASHRLLPTTGRRLSTHMGHPANHSMKQRSAAGSRTQLRILCHYHRRRHWRAPLISAAPPHLPWLPWRPVATPRPSSSSSAPSSGGRTPRAPARPARP